MMTDDTMNQMIRYTDGHECRPNGVGDYEMVCPTFGVLLGFVPFMRRAVLRGRCSGCGLLVKPLDRQRRHRQDHQHH